MVHASEVKELTCWRHFTWYSSSWFQSP